jgi:hypothetical protein
MAQQEWGRNEATIWPRRGMIRTLGALFIALVAIFAIAYLRFAFGLSPLQRFYLPAFARSAALAQVTQNNAYRLLLIADAKGRSRFAVDSDLIPGETKVSDARPVPFALSDLAKQSGFLRLILAPKRPCNNAQLHAYLRYWVYANQDVRGLFAPALWSGLGLFVLQLFFTIPKDLEHRRELRYGRRLKGPELLTVRRFNRRLGADGIGFALQARLKWMQTRVRIPRRLESSHILIMGDSGTGKSSLIRQLLLQIRDRQETAIVYDPALEYLPHFYQPERGDVVLNPLDTRMPYWSIGEELEHASEAMAIAESLFPDRDRENQFFVDGPRKIFAHLLSYRPTFQELIQWLCQPKEIERRVRGTELAPFIDPKAPAQRSGILSSLNMVADAFKTLPMESDTARRWTATEWSKTRKGWIFLTSLPVHRKKLLPLSSLWLDWLVLRLMDPLQPPMPRVWFVLDELASLQRLPQLHTAVTENRKFNNPLILGFQGRSQLEKRYGKDAETMLAQPATKIFLRTNEPHAAKWVSEAVGEIEIERLRESHHQGRHKGKNFSLDRQVEPLVLASEISGLRDLRAYMKLENYVLRFVLPVVPLNEFHAGFLPRPLSDGFLSLPGSPAPATESSSAAEEKISPRQAEDLGQQKLLY